MKDISKRIKALFFLRFIFLISLVVGIGSLLVEIIALSFGDGHVFSEAGSITILVFVTIFGILRILVVVLSAAIFILVMKINKECMGAFLTAFCSAILGIVSMILQYTNGANTVTLTLSLVSGIGLSIATFMLIDGIFDQQARKNPLFSFAMLGICLMVVSSVLSFLTYTIKVQEGLVGAIYMGSQMSCILYSIILFMAINSCLKDVKNIEESEPVQQ